MRKTISNRRNTKRNTSKRSINKKSKNSISLKRVAKKTASRRKSAIGSAKKSFLMRYISAMNILSDIKRDEIDAVMSNTRRVLGR